MAIVSDFSVGGELVKMGLVPEQCSELRITCTPNNVVILETKSCVTQDWWDKFVKVVGEAKANGRVLAIHATVNIETGEVVES